MSDQHPRDERALKDRDNSGIGAATAYLISVLYPSALSSIRNGGELGKSLLIRRSGAVLYD
jgi:hypothetical protein